MSKSEHSVPEKVMLFGDKVTTDVISYDEAVILKYHPNPIWLVSL